MNKKILAALLAVLLATASCGTQSDTNKETTAGNSDDTTTVETEKNVYDELEAKNYGGRTFTILDSNQAPSQDVNIPGDSMNGDVVNDALYQRGMDVSDRFGVNIEYVQMTPAEGSAAMKNSVLAGDSDYQLMIAQIKGGNLGTLATDGVLANLCDVPGLSLDQKWWSSLMYENLKLNDTMYFTSGDISPTMYTMPAAIYLNKKLLDDYGITTDYYQMVRDGKWTIDELTALAKDRDIDMNDDGVMHANDDFFGFAHQSNSTTMSFLIVGCGINLSDNVDGKIEINLDSEYAFEVYDKISALKRVIKFDNQDDIQGKAFFDDRAIAVLHLVSSTKDFRNMKSDFSVLPVPKYDEKQENYHSLCNPWSDAFIGIPINADYEFVGTVTEALARYSYVNVRPKVLDLNLQQKGLRDTESIEMLNIIYDTAYLDFNICYVFGGLLDQVADALINDKAIASVVASNISKAESAAADLVAEAFTKD